MKILGWILTILGGVLCFGAIIMYSNGEYESVYTPSLLFAIALLVIGLVILKYKKKNK
jgi:uncharacterized membrane protein HdeD (DUF308 family)